MQTPLVHIGYPKTASTWLQKRLLPLRGDMLLVRRATPGASWIEDMGTLPAERFDAVAARARFEASIAGAGHRIPVISYEAFVGDPFADASSRSLSPVELARRVAEVIPEARVAMVIREPVALLASLYRQYVQIGGLEDPVEALHGSAAAAPALSREFAHFDSAYGRWVAGFGRERVRVLVYEQLLEDPRGFVDGFIEFAGATATKDELPVGRANRGTAGPALSALRFANRFAASRFNESPWLPAGWIEQKWARRFLQRGVSPWLRQASGAEEIFGAVTRAELNEHFRSHNRALEAAAGLDLRRYGYAC